jgi:hypothetical protein
MHSFQERLMLLRFTTIAAFLFPLATVFAQTGDDLDQQVTAIFKQKCTVCHDDRPGDSAGDVNNLLKFMQLSDADSGYISASPSESYLAELIRDEKMPLPEWKGEVKGDGPLSADEKQTVLKWIERGGPSADYRMQANMKSENDRRRRIPERRTVEDIAKDLLTLDGASLKNARYLTLTNLHNRDGVTSAELELHRQGMVKMLNSLSRSSDVLGMPDSPAVNQVVAIDKEATVYRFDLRHLGWTSADWDRIVKHYPYGLIHSDGVGRSVYTLTDSSLPYMRADWFVFATSQAPLYHELLGITEQLSELEHNLGIDRHANIRSFQVARAAFSNSKVSVNNRMVERHSFRGGYYHISYDCFRNDGRAKFFDFPLGPRGVFDTEFAFDHDGGEVIFSLPNGFQGYVLTTASGKRLSIAPSAVVHDDSMPAGAILNGISCISCHYSGMKPENPEQVAGLDELREMTLANKRRFNATDRQMIEQLYPPGDQFKALLETDRSAWLATLQKAGLTQTGPLEPVRVLFDSFVKNLDLDVAAADFGVSVKEFEKLLNGEGETRQLAMRLKVKGVQRQLYVEEFRQIARLTGLGDPRDFEALNVPFFGHDTETVAAPADAGTTEATPSTPVESDLLAATNQAANLHVSLGAMNDEKLFREGDTIPCRIKANQECFVTILGIDPLGEVSCLLPNQWHHEKDGDHWWSPLKLQANRTLEINPQTVNFELFAQPPHGATKLRVIVTRGAPLKLRLDKNIAAQLTTKGIPTLGFAQQKGIGARPGAVPPASASRPQIPDNMTDKPLTDLFTPNDWATVEWTFFTKP